MATSNCQYSTRYCWDADKVKSLIRLRAELSPLFTGKRNASKYAWAVVERELNVPLPLSKIIKKWNNLLQEYKAIKISEEPKRREWPFFTLMDVYFSDQVNDPSLRLFSSTKTLKESLDESVFEDDPIIVSAIAAVTSGACMEIEELLKRQKDRRANENKFVPESKYTPENHFLTSEKGINSKPTSYSVSGGNKANVVTVKNLNFMQQQQVDNENNLNKSPSDQNDLVKKEKINISPKPILRQQQQQQSPPSPAVQNKYSDPNSIDQYLLSWNNFLGNMSRGFHTLQKDEKMVDVTIAAGGKIFKAHKLVLSVCSPYFQEIFLENPSNHPILLMADVEANHMEGLLNFMYSGQVNVKYEDLPVFLKVAEAMKIKGLHTEKPEGQNLGEIQFSRDDTSADMQALNASSMPINFMDHSTGTSLTTEKERQCHTTFHPIDRNKNLDLQQYNPNALNFEQASNKFSILKTNGSKKLSEHLKQQKYLTKRKIFVHCENEFREKRSVEISDKGPYNNSPSNLVHMTQRTLHDDNPNNEEILNLAQNGAPNVPKRFLPAIPVEPKNDNTYNQTSYVEIRDEHNKDAYMDDKIPFYGSNKSNEDGNNNTLNTFNPNNNNNNNVDASKNYPNNNCYNPPRNANVFINSSERSENDDNNNGSTDSNYDTKANIIKQADNNNNVFSETPSDKDKEKKDSSTEEIKVKSYSNLY